MVVSSQFQGDIFALHATLTMSCEQLTVLIRTNSRINSVFMRNTKSPLLWICVALWFAFSVWRNVPHDLKASVATALTASASSNGPFNDGGLVTGFPLTYLNYRLAEDSHTQVIGFHTARLVANICLCSLGCFGIAWVAASIERISLRALLGLTVAAAALIMAQRSAGTFSFWIVETIPQVWILAYIVFYFWDAMFFLPLLIAICVSVQRSARFNSSTRLLDNSDLCPIDPNAIS